MSLIEKVGQADAAEERVVDHLLLKELLKNLDKDERKADLSTIFFGKDTDTGRKRTWNFTGSGIQNGKRRY